MIWLIIGLALGFALGNNRRSNDNPKDLEKSKAQQSRQEQDIAYYKKLTRTLVEENKSLRIEIDEYKNPKNKKD